MPTILPIRELRDTSKISEIAHKQQEPIHITKNGYNYLAIYRIDKDKKIVYIVTIQYQGRDV